MGNIVRSQINTSEGETVSIYRTILVATGVLLGSQVGNGQTAPKNNADSQRIERGRYVVLVGGCNDCHTAGYGEANAKTPESERLKGDVLGFRGPWGTTYPTNLRLSLRKMTEDQWLTYGKRLMARAPMPWFNIRGMSDADLRALYQYVKSLPGDSGTPAPAFVPPDKQPKPPYVQWPGVK
jgi:mono/diheme cytochrome c family protein